MLLLLLKLKLALFPKVSRHGTCQGFGAEGRACGVTQSGLSDEKEKYLFVNTF